MNLLNFPPPLTLTTAMYHAPHPPPHVVYAPLPPAPSFAKGSGNRGYSEPGYPVAQPVQIPRQEQMTRGRGDRRQPRSTKPKHKFRLNSIHISVIIVACVVYWGYSGWISDGVMTDWCDNKTHKWTENCSVLHHVGAWVLGPVILPVVVVVILLMGAGDSGGCDGCGDCGDCDVECCDGASSAGPLYSSNVCSCCDDCFFTKTKRKRRQEFIQTYGGNIGVGGNPMWYV